MLRQVRCECGYVARSQREDEIISLILAHVATDHPDLDVRNWIELVPD
jgi:predicted small metal-binding protein